MRTIFVLLVCLLLYRWRQTQRQANWKMGRQTEIGRKKVKKKKMKCTVLNKILANNRRLCGGLEWWPSVTRYDIDTNRAVKKINDSGTISSSGQGTGSISYNETSRWFFDKYTISLGRPFSSHNWLLHSECASHSLSINRNGAHLIW